MWPKKRRRKNLSKNFWSNKYLGKNNFEVLVKKNLSPKRNLIQKNVFPKKDLDQKNVTPNKIRNFFWVQKLFRG